MKTKLRESTQKLLVWGRKSLAHWKCRLQHCWASVRATGRKLRALIPIVGYFFIYWQYVDKVRMSVLRGALSFLSVGLVVFLLEMSIKTVSEPLISLFTAAHQPMAKGLTWGAALVVLWHTIHEILELRERHHHDDRTWQLLFREEPANELELIKVSLPSIALALERYGASRVTVWLPEGDQLVVKDGFMFPAASEADQVLRHLPIGQGVAGRVFADGLMRYVPRVRFPSSSARFKRWSIAFPHAIEFHPMRGRSGQLEVAGRGISPNVVIPATTLENTMKHCFVAVPVSSFRRPVSGSGIESFGVLCVDFQNENALSAYGVKTVAALGFVLARNLENFKDKRL